VVLAANAAGLARLVMCSSMDARIVSEHRGDTGAARFANLAVNELERFFQGDLRSFSVPLSLDDLTLFQRAVLQEVARIPYGAVLTYGEVAARIGRPNSARAVGGALARNPISIIIPCHRVVAHDGTLHGFSSPMGIMAKADLLRHEGVNLENDKVRFTPQTAGSEMR
jgi:methylated-DNA-[protein]-cysteine S-methyltransferase